jgi:2-oxoglutarate ferredoxin oxidoreductase subunit beta
VDDILVHNTELQDNTLHYMLARMTLPDFPVAMGVIRAADGPVYESLLYDQITSLKKESGLKKMDDLLTSGNVFEVK